MPKKTYIKISITKSHHFRAKIKRPVKNYTEEVTIGGHSWREGKCKDLREKILNKVNTTLFILLHQFFEKMELSNQYIVKGEQYTYFIKRSKT